MPPVVQTRSRLTSLLQFVHSTVPSNVSCGVMACRKLAVIVSGVVVLAMIGAPRNAGGTSDAGIWTPPSSVFWMNER